jgi:hypothetical protein
MGNREPRAAGLDCGIRETVTVGAVRVQSPLWVGQHGMREVMFFLSAGKRLLPVLLSPPWRNELSAASAVSLFFLFRLSKTLCAVLRGWDGRGGSVEGWRLSTALRGAQCFLWNECSGAEVAGLSVRPNQFRVGVSCSRRRREER